MISGDGTRISLTIPRRLNNVIRFGQGYVSRINNRMSVVIFVWIYVFRHDP
jgi:hypothetical protein